MSTACSHLDQIREVEPSNMEGCSECLETGGQWVHLRMCLTCGQVGCCDSSPNRHASKHASKHASEHGHALANSFEPGEDWSWCYVDEVAIMIPGIPHPHRLRYRGERR